MLIVKMSIMITLTLLFGISTTSHASGNLKSNTPIFKIEVGGPFLESKVSIDDIKLLTIQNFFYSGFYPGSKVKYKKETMSDAEGWHRIDYGIIDPQGYHCQYKATLKTKGTKLKYEFNAKTYRKHNFQGALVWGFLNSTFFNKAGFGKIYTKVKTTQTKMLLGKIKEAKYDNIFGQFEFKFNNNSGDWFLRDTSMYTCYPSTFGFGTRTRMKPGEIEELKCSFEIDFIPASHFELRKKIAQQENLGKAFYQSVDIPHDKLFAAFTNNLAEIKRLQLELDKNAIQLKRKIAYGNDLAKKIISQRPVYDSGTRQIVPCPQEVSYKKGSYVFNDKSVIILPQNSDSYLETAARDLKNELCKHYACDIKIVKGKIAASDARPIMLNVAKKGNFFKGKKLPDNKEGYILSVSPNKIELTGSSSIGALRGMQSLILLTGKRPDAKIDALCCEVRDWPDIAFRCAVLETRGRNFKHATENAINTLIRFKYNAVFFDSRFHALDNSPIAKDSYCAVSPAELRKMVKLLKAHGITPIPLLQLGGHSDHILRHRPDLSESQNKKKPGYSYCLTSPKVKKFLAGLIDETLEIFDNPENFHIGCDEIRLFAQCPSCKQYTPDKLLADQVNWAVGYLKKQGVKNIFMWHDMLLDSKVWKGTVAHSGNALYKKPTHLALDKISKDVIICFWSYHETGSFPALKYFQDNSFRVIGTSWMQDDNCYQMAAAIKKLDAYGIATWPPPGINKEGISNLYAVENSWSVGKPSFKKIAYNQDEITSRQKSGLPSGFVGTKLYPVDIKDKCNRSLENLSPGNPLNWNSSTPTVDLRFLATGNVELGGLKFDIIPKNKNEGKQCIAVGHCKGYPLKVMGIPINHKAKSLVFLHTATGYTECRWKVGEYVINYEDGTKIIVDLKAPLNIISSLKNYSSATNWKNYPYRGGLPQSKQIWRGFSVGGDALDIQAYEWVNPFPEKKIKGVDIIGKKPHYVIRLLALSFVK